MELEQGNETLFVVREVNLNLTLAAATLYSSRADLISRQLLEPIKALCFRIRVVVSDADENIWRAVEASLLGCPHQACQVHCLCDADSLIFEADRAMKTDLRRDTRSGAKLRPVSRELSRSPQADLLLAVLADYCEGLRDALRADGLSPFELAGLELYTGQQRLETSLRQYEKKEHPLLSALLKITAIRQDYAELYAQLKRQSTRAIELARLLEPDDEHGRPRTARQVKREATNFWITWNRKPLNAPPTRKSSPV